MVSIKNKLFSKLLFLINKGQPTNKINTNFEIFNKHFYKNIDEKYILLFGKEKDERFNCPKFKKFKKYLAFEYKIIELYNIEMIDYNQFVIEMLFFHLKFSKTTHNISKQFYAIDRISLFNQANPFFYLLVFSRDDLNNLLEYDDKFLNSLLFEYIIILESVITDPKELSFKKINKTNLSLLNNFYDELNPIIQDVENKDPLSFNKKTPNHENLLLSIENDFKKLKKINPNIVSKYIIFTETLISSYTKLNINNIIQIKHVINLIFIKNSNFLKTNKHYTALYNYIKNTNTVALTTIILIIKFLLSLIIAISLTLSYFNTNKIFQNNRIRLEHLELNQAFKKIKGKLLPLIINTTNLYKTSAFSTTPYHLIKINSFIFIETNGLISGTLPIFSTKPSKILIRLDKNPLLISTLEKQIKQPFLIKKDLLAILNFILQHIKVVINEDEIIDTDSSFSPLNSENIIFNSFHSFIKYYDLEEIYFPFYFDSRYRLYSYSVFAPTSNRVVRYITMYKDLPNTKIIEGLQNHNFLKNYNIGAYINKLYDSLEPNLKGSLNRSIGGVNYQNFIGQEDLNNFILFLTTAQRFSNEKGKKPHAILNDFSNFLKKLNVINLLIEAKLKGREYISKNYLILFKSLLAYNNYDKSNTIEDFYCLYTFISILFFNENHTVIFDVSASALVLCGLITGVKDQTLLNLNNNQFIKSDPYNLIQEEFSKNFTNELGTEFDFLKDRKLYKGPSMTLLYGAKRTPSIGRIRSKLIFKKKISPKKAQLWASLMYTSLAETLTISKVNDFNKKLKIIHNNLQLSNQSQNLLDKVFFIDNILKFQNEWEENLLISGGFIKINGEFISLNYILDGGRLSSIDKGKKRTRLSIKNFKIEVLYDRLIIDSKINYEVSNDVIYNLVEKYQTLDSNSSPIFSTNKANDLFKSLSIHDKERLSFILKYLYSNKNKYSNAFRANTIHSIDAYIVRKLITGSEYPILTNHDAFFVSNHRIHDLISKYNTIVEELELEVNGKKYCYNIKITDNLPFFT